MENIEKQFEKEEKTTLEKLEGIKAGKEAIKKEDPQYSSPWLVIDLQGLIPKAIETYEYFEKKEFQTALTKLEVLKEQVKQIKDVKRRENNEHFIRLIDGEIEAALLNQQTKPNE